MAILSSELKGLKASPFHYCSLACERKCVYKQYHWAFCNNCVLWNRMDTEKVQLRLVCFYAFLIYFHESHPVWCTLFLLLANVTDICRLVLFLGLFWSSDHINARVESQKQPTQSISIHTCQHTESKWDFLCHYVICKAQCKCTLH